MLEGDNNYFLGIVGPLGKSCGVILDRNSTSVGNLRKI